MANLLEKASIILTPTAYDDGKVLAIKPSEAPYGDFDFTRNSSATRVNAQGLVEDVQILSSNLVQNGDFSEIGSEEVTNGSFSQEGSEQITNGDFATDSDWGKVNSTISDGKGNLDSTNGTSLLFQSALVIGKTYKATLEVSNYNGIGLCALITSSGATQQEFTSNGVKEFYFTHGGTQLNLTFRATNGGIFSIDNVSCVEVGQDWTLGTGWSIGEDKAIQDGTNGDLQQNSLVTGLSYKVTLEVLDYVQGSLVVRLGSGNAIATITANGTYTFYGVASTTLFRLRAQVGFIGSITNISVKEVAQNWYFYGESEFTSQGARIYSSTGSYSALNQSNVLTIGNKYKITFDVISTNGTNLASGDGTIIYDTSTTGNKTFYITASEDVFQLKRVTAPSDVTVTNISVLEITDDTNLPRINYSGFTYQDSLGSELITNGDFATDSNWTKDSNWSIADGVATSTGSGRMFQSIPALESNVGTKVKVSFDITERTSGGVKIDCYGAASNVITEVGTHTFIGTTTNSLNLYINNSGQGNLVGSIDNVSVKEYLGQEVVPDSGCGAWLFEPQSTNLVIYSEDYNQWLGGGSITISNSSSVSSPSNSNSVGIITGTVGTVSKFVRIDVTTTSLIHTYSSFFKYNSHQWVQFASGGTSEYANFDIQNGVVGNKSSGTTSTIDNFGNGWYRCTLSTSVASAPSNMAVVVIDSATSLRLSPTSSVGSIYIWGAQLEAQSYPTSYIPTEGTIKTRNQDLCTNGGDVSLINSSEGVLYAQISALADDGTSRSICLSNGFASERVLFRYDTASNRLQFFIVSASVIQANLTFDVSNTLDVLKFAIKYKENDFALWVNGIEVDTVNSGTTPIGLNTLQFANGTGGQPFFGNTKALGVWKEALTDVELRSLTYPTPTAPTFDLDFNTIATDFTFTRNSEATFVNAQGLIQSTNKLGAEEITNGSFDTDSDWSKGTAWSISGGEAILTNAPSNWVSLAQVALTSGKYYLVSLNVNSISGGSLVVNTTNGTFTGGETISTTGLKTFYLTSATTSLRIMGLTGCSASIDNVSVKEYLTETNTPRLDYSTGAEAFLLEPQRTNLVPFSNEFSNVAWEKTNSSITANATISPDGTQNADKVVESATLSYTRVRDSVYFTNGDDYTFSVFAKADERDFIQLEFNTSSFLGSANAWFDLTNKTVVTQGSGINSSKIEDYGNGWLRCSITATADADGGALCAIYISDSNSSVYQGDGVSGLYIYGAQIEEGYLTSYIPTNGTTVTRNQELCYDATPVINSEEGVLYAEIAALSNDGTNRAISISDGTTSNVVRFYYSTTDNRIVGNVKSGGITSFNFNNVLSNATNFLKIAISYKLNNFKMYVNGIEVASDTVGNAPIGLSELSFDNGAGNDNLFGNTKGLKVYPKALTDVELQDLTTI